MSKHGTQHGALHISGTGLPGGTTVQLDGKDIAAALTGLTLRICGEARPTAVLDVVLHDLATDVAEPRIVVPAKTEALLVQLGWTPPVDGEQQGDGS
ncbi:hypothetical protein AB0O08_11775 [Streptomyces anulatus]|uniref:hypothetical protein n=1 Tax=Streptomyces anulatus TaxID=1892 RepID=UPI00342A5E08